MRSLSPAAIKNNSRSRPLHRIPREGTHIRALYDLLMERRGRIVDVPLTVLAGNGSRCIEDLIDYYGLDIRRIAYGQWILAGEWFGRVYVDYIAEALANADSKKETQQ